MAKMLNDNSPARKLLSMDQIEEVHIELRVGTTTRNIAAMFNISSQLVGHINNGDYEHYRIRSFVYPVRVPLTRWNSKKVRNLPKKPPNWYDNPNTDGPYIDDCYEMPILR
jgi:phage portal protein BeeE